MSGQTMEVLNNTDAAKFGLATTDSGSEMILRGRAFKLADGTSKSFDVTRWRKYMMENNYSYS